jgi:cardiolipin synthase
VIARYAQSPRGFLRAADVKLLVDGREAFPEMLGAIAAARRTIEMESYILRPDRTGRRFGEALAAAARRGVRVRLMYDALGSLGLPSSYLRQLTSAGAAVSVYHPLILTRPSWAINRRNHRKLIVVDDAVAFTGGLNIADEYATKEDGGAGWRDTHMRLDGAQPARELRALFEDAWERAKPLPGSPAFAARPVEGQPPAPSVSDGVAAQVLGNDEFRNRRRIRRAHLYAINHARQYILIENAYFIPDRGVRRALVRAVRRGVKVAVAMAAVGSSDVAIAAYASRVLNSELLAAGVRLFEWRHGMLHAKTAVVDDAWAVVGSYNFDHRSLSHDLEVAVVVAEASFARRLREQTLADLGRCHEVTLAEHEARPWSRMLLESAAYQMRYWL